MKHEDLKVLADLVVQLDTFDLVWDFDQLAKLGAGTLWIDLRGCESFFNGRPVRLQFPVILHAGLHQTLGGDPATALEEASLKMRFTTERHPEQRDRDVEWDETPAEFVTCEAKCRSRIGVPGRTASAMASHTFEWPYDYGALFKLPEPQR